MYYFRINENTFKDWKKKRSNPWLPTVHKLISVGASKYLCQLSTHYKHFQVQQRLLTQSTVGGCTIYYHFTLTNIKRHRVLCLCEPMEQKRVQLAWSRRMAKTLIGLILQDILDQARNNCFRNLLAVHVFRETGNLWSGNG